MNSRTYSLLWTERRSHHYLIAASANQEGCQLVSVVAAVIRDQQQFVTKHELPYISSAFLYGWTWVQPVCRSLQLSSIPFSEPSFPSTVLLHSCCGSYHCVTRIQFSYILQPWTLTSGEDTNSLTIKVIISRHEATSQVRDRLLWDWRCSQRCCWRYSFLGIWRRGGQAVPGVSSYPGTLDLHTGNFLRMKRFWATFAWSEAGWCLSFFKKYFFFLLEGGTKWLQARASHCDYSISALFSPLFLTNTQHSGVPPGTASIWNMQLVLLWLTL
jgi:hypothetical protein